MKIIHFADLHLGVETYGKINPETGVSTRLDDFLAALDKLVDYALESKIDLVLFCGDAYKSREPSQTQQREFARRINRLASGGITIFILVGNHDLPNAIGKATSTEIFHTLAVKNVYVSNKPEITRIKTKSGTIQIASLPWLRRSALLKRDEAKNLTLEQINQQLQQVLTNTVADLAKQLDPKLPAILAAHVGVASATVGSERLMAIGQEAFILPGNLANPAFDYIALGHIHKRQVLNENPPVVYAGSLERVDFGEEADEKGFYVVDIPASHILEGAAGREADKQSSHRRVSFEFHPVTGRSFRTITVNLEAGDADPTATVLKAIHPDKEDPDRIRVKDAIVRLQISLPAELEGQLRDSDIRGALKEAYFSTVAREVKRETRLRLGHTAAEEIPPLEALKTYLETNYTPERAKVLIEYGERLIEGQAAEGK
ncbi:MAG: nuclease SbcCD subunit D [Chloroflexi bacterium RBG_16_51_9]|nr:MAG: nuclease SbcCD subunit D [Chloroflexi bacterium RBG_16_51_9]